MSEEIAEIEKAISQASNIIETLMRLQQRLQKQEQHQVNVPTAQINNNQLDHLSRLHAKLTELNTHEAATQLLRSAVADKTMTPDQAATELLRLAPSELPASRKITLREDAKVAFENGQDLSTVTKQFDKAVEPPNIKQGITIKRF